MTKRSSSSDEHDAKRLKTTFYQDLFPRLCPGKTTPCPTGPQMRDDSLYECLDCSNNYTTRLKNFQVDETKSQELIQHFTSVAPILPDIIGMIGANPSCRNPTAEIPVPANALLHRMLLVTKRLSRVFSDLLSSAPSLEHTMDSEMIWAVMELLDCGAPTVEGMALTLARNIICEDMCDSDDVRYMQHGLLLHRFALYTSDPQAELVESVVEWRQLVEQLRRECPMESAVDELENFLRVSIRNWVRVN